VKLELHGLLQARDNMKKLGKIVQTKVARDAMRTLSWALARPMRAATYTTFVKRTGAIRRGLGVWVAFNADEGTQTLRAWVVEYQQSIAGPADAFKALVRKRTGRKKRGAVKLTSTAYWWRFLEKGTGPRRSVATPKAMRTGKWSGREKVRTRQQAAASRWQTTGGSRGAIKPRPWLIPAFNAAAPSAIEEFRTNILSSIDREIEEMPKGGQ
jgi:hypothetical protein